MQESTGKPVIVGGDFNVAHQNIDMFAWEKIGIRSGFTKEEKHSFGNFLRDKKFVDTFRFLNPDLVKYTQWDIRTDNRKKGEGWRYDYFLCSGQLVASGGLYESVVNDKQMGSDHCPISVSIDLSKVYGIGNGPQFEAK